MKKIKFSVFVFLVCTLSFVNAEIWHVSQAGSGDQTGSSISNSIPMAEYLTSAKWGSGVGLIGPGDVVFFHGAIASKISVLGSGTTGSPINLDLTDATINTSESTQIDLRGNDYLELYGGTFSSAVSSGDLIHLGDNCTNIVVSGFEYYGQPDSNVTAISHSSGSFSIVENNHFENVKFGITGDSVANNNIQIRNNVIITNQEIGIDTSTGVSDIIKIGDAYNVTIEGNYLCMRRRGDLPHCDIIQTYMKGGANAGNPADWIIRYNLFEMNTTAQYNRSYMMLEQIKGTFAIYGNVFLGTDGGEGANGIRVKYNSGPLNLYLYNNTFINRSGPGNTVSFDDVVGTARMYNNVFYIEDEGTVLQIEMDLDHDYNYFYGGRSNGYNGTSSSNFAGPNSIVEINPYFTDYANGDFSLKSTSPLLNSGAVLGLEYRFRIATGAVWPKPAITEVAIPSIGAYSGTGTVPTPPTPTPPTGLRLSQ